MIKVITYGTFDLLHYGHIKLLERAKALGDYLIVGVTADDFDKSRGKINVKQSIMERVEAIRSTGIADEVIIEEFEGQKIDDIRRYEIDIFTVGSDWVGKFDYLKEYCKVIYLDRTQGISSTELRTKSRVLRLGLVGESNVLLKYIHESSFVNGIEISCVFTHNENIIHNIPNNIAALETYEAVLMNSDAVYIVVHPEHRYETVKKALNNNKHVICEAPITLNEYEYLELIELARNKKLVLMDAIKTQYATAYNRLILLVKSGAIGNVVSVESTCTSLKSNLTNDGLKDWNSITVWGAIGLLPIFQILGIDYKKKQIITCRSEQKIKYDIFTKIDFEYEHGLACMKVGNGVKSEGELIISGTKGYAYVPAPWWKTDYFEIRYENTADNKRYFYQLDGEGIRYMLVAFAKCVENSSAYRIQDESITKQIIKIMEDFYCNRDVSTFTL